MSKIKKVPAHIKKIYAKSDIEKSKFKFINKTKEVYMARNTMRKTHPLENQIPIYMVEPYMKWCKDSGLEPYNKYSIEEWKKTEDYYFLNSIGEGAPIDILNEDDDDEQQIHADEVSDLDF